MLWDTIKKNLTVKTITKAYYLLVLFFYFCYKIIESGWVVALLVLKGSRGEHGGFFDYMPQVHKSWQLVILFNMVSMTPGSLSVDLKEDGDVIQVHLLRISDKEDFLAVTAKIERLLIKAL
jgi:multisubunit Na+/H+ antiporter MnhE subunit